jgi:hypothetical protein
VFEERIVSIPLDDKGILQQFMKMLGVLLGCGFRKRCSYNKGLQLVQRDEFLIMNQVVNFGVDIAVARAQFVECL